MNKPYSILEDPNLRPNVGIMLVNGKHQILAGEAVHYPSEWMMPQGGINPDETPQQAMSRELYEETGIQDLETRFILENDDWISYCFRKPLVKEGRLYTGQRQKWFLLEYNGEIPDAAATLDREFLQFRWVGMDWLIEHTTAFKAPVYQTIFDEFRTSFP